MSFFDDASLAFLPSSGAGKDGKAYSIKPTTGAGDFTFSRGSNLAATRVGPTGLIEKGRENLLLQSNQFDTTWTLNGATLTSGQIGYDGSNDAWSLISTTANSKHRIIQTFTGGSNSVVTYSLFAKSNGYDFLRIVENASTGDFATFNLSVGSVINNTGIADTAIIESFGNGWYRCSISVNSGNTTRFDIYTMETSGATDFLGDGVSGAYIQDAQVELGLVATDYIESGATTGKAGLLEDEPRFDYSGGATCPSLLLEPSRTNSIKQSEYFGIWTNVSSNPVDVVDNFAISPEGVQNAAKLTFNGVNSWKASPSMSLTQQTYTASVWLKVEDGGGDISGWLSMYATGTGAVRQDVSITITSEWQRFEAVFDSWTLGAGLVYLVIRSNTDGRSCLAYGAQLEAGSYPTSYIPNHSGGSVTRGEDNTGTINVSSLGVTTGYTLFYELGKYNVSAPSSWLAQTGAGAKAYQVYSTTAIIKTTSGDVYPFSHGLTGTGIKVAVNYDGVNINVFTNGTKQGTWPANQTIWNGLTNLDMNLSNSQMVNWNQLLVFPTALSDADCINLTTL